MAEPFELKAAPAKVQAIQVQKSSLIHPPWARTPTHNSIDFTRMWRSVFFGSRHKQCQSESLPSAPVEVARFIGVHQERRWQRRRFLIWASALSARASVFPFWPFERPGLATLRMGDAA